ncbi:hypothetical protein NQ317_005339 [Molorchus minor]|uniref:Uncharacterized protein n=1 Tax=Molorchus minor TaxID=1323400 RepID=A0ABQ9IUT1_9CUCU|nr:hypothetical protein NQ317_005339 [Molorchus minor]
MCEDSDKKFYLFQAINTEMTDMFIKHEEPRITIWALNDNSTAFEIYQTIYEEEPTSIATVSYNCRQYLAVAYGHLQNTMHFGRVSIKRFEEETQQFVPWQNINLKTPTHVEFAK